MHRTQRAVAVLVLSTSLFAGTATSMAFASPAQEAIYLSALKSNWSTMSAQDKANTCGGYKVSHSRMIAQSVIEVWKDPASRKALSKPAWKRVITKYLAWACPNDRPRP